MDNLIIVSTYQKQKPCPQDVTVDTCPCEESPAIQDDTIVDDRNHSYSLDSDAFEAAMHKKTIKSFTRS